MENVNKNWVLGRPLVFGDKEQIAELARLKSIKDKKDSMLTDGLELDSSDVDIEVERTCVSMIEFKCFKCEAKVFAEIDDFDVESDDPDDDQNFCHCRTCKVKYKLEDNIIYIKK